MAKVVLLDHLQLLGRESYRALYFLRVLRDEIAGRNLRAIVVRDQIDTAISDWRMLPMYSAICQETWREHHRHRCQRAAAQRRSARGRAR